jgi:serine phosphatase RsbU (regulator of sigma subunit)
MAQKATVGELKPASTRFWRSLFEQHEVEPSPADASPVDPCPVDPCPVDPVRSETPVIRDAEIAAVYSGQRVAGDFYEFLRVGPSRMLFVLLDIAGMRSETRGILIAVQQTFQTRAPELFSGEDFNETTAMIDLCHEMNLTILHGGLRSCPAFIGCYNEDMGTVCYANAGHIPALLRDDSGITPLTATGLPLGLFSHTTQSAAACHLLPGAALLVVSRGIVESDFVYTEEFDSEQKAFEHKTTEFGLRGVKLSLQRAGVGKIRARELCLTVLQAARMFSPTTPTENDLTALALVRDASSQAT